jgi:hypothetical protein
MLTLDSGKIRIYTLGLRQEAAFFDQNHRQGFYLQHSTLVTPDGERFAQARSWQC